MAYSGPKPNELCKFPKYLKENIKHTSYANQLDVLRHTDLEQHRHEVINRQEVQVYELKDAY